MKAMVRNNICLNAHPQGCKKAVLDQIDYTKARAESRKNGTLSGLDERDNNGVAAPKNVLVLGCSNGYGLASRITATFGYGASTIGVSFEKAGTEKKWGTPGWYNNLAFDEAAAKEYLTQYTCAQAQKSWDWAHYMISKLGEARIMDNCKVWKDDEEFN